MEFKVANMDRPAIITTLAVTMLLVGLSIFFVLKIPYGWFFAILMIAIIILSYLLSPRSYSIEHDHLIIQKVIGRRISISLQDVQAYTVVPNFAKLRVSRTFGNGGIFGYYGTFSTAEFGTISCQLRSLKDVFMIKTYHGIFAISPAHKAKFEETFVNKVKSLTGTVTSLTPTMPGTIRQANPLILILPAAIFTLTMIMVFVLYTKLPDRIAVHFDMQGNPDGWASQTSFMISGILPAAVLLLINTAIFFFVRRTTIKPTLPYLLVVLFSVFQIFTLYVSLDTYWINVNERHLIPFPFNIILYGLIIVAMLYVYYRKTKTSA